jgi:hypothetical protein
MERRVELIASLGASILGLIGLVMEAQSLFVPERGVRARGIRGGC